MVNPLKEQRRVCAIHAGDSRRWLANYAERADLIVTSPPYADARKGHYDSIAPDQFADWFLTFHDSFWNALRDDGSLIINIKDKVVDGRRHRYVWKTIEKLEAAGWWCIEDYIWNKPNPMPGYWPNRLRDGWEYCFHLAKCKRPYMNQDAVRVPIGEWAKTRLEKLGDGDKTRHNSENQSGFGRDLSRWVGKDTVLPTNVLNFSPVTKNKGHPAAYPLDLPSFFIKLFSRPGSLVIDPFGGSGTTGIAALNLQRDCVLVDMSPEYCGVAYERIKKEVDLKQCDIVYDDLVRNVTERTAAKRAEQLLLFIQQRHGDVQLEAKAMRPTGSSARM